MQRSTETHLSSVRVLLAASSLSSAATLPTVMPVLKSLPHQSTAGRAASRDSTAPLGEDGDRTLT